MYLRWIAHVGIWEMPVSDGSLFADEGGDV